MKEIEQIYAFQKAILPIDIDYIDEQGVRLGNIWKAIESVGLYISPEEPEITTITKIIAAKVAGVRKLVIAFSKDDLSCCNLDVVYDENLSFERKQPDYQWSVFDFLKRMSVIECSQGSFDNLAENTEILANQEGLAAHALSISIRRSGA